MEKLVPIGPQRSNVWIISQSFKLPSSQFFFLFRKWLSKQVDFVQEILAHFLCLCVGMTRPKTNQNICLRNAALPLVLFLLLLCCSRTCLVVLRADSWVCSQGSCRGPRGVGDRTQACCVRGERLLALDSSPSKAACFQYCSQRELCSAVYSRGVAGTMLRSCVGNISINVGTRIIRAYLKT